MSGHMRTLLRIIASFFIGLIVTYLAVIGGMFWYASANNIVDRDGGMSMSIAFILGPSAAILGGLFLAIAAPILLARRDRARAARDLPPAKRVPVMLKVWLVAIIAGSLGYFATVLGLWLKGPIPFRTYWEAYAISRSPIYVGIAVASLAAWIAYRASSRKRT
jgi:hypothetical protein